MAAERAGDAVLHVVMNGRVIGDVQRTGRRSMRLRYDDLDEAAFTPLSVSMRDPRQRYRERALVPWLEGLLPDRPETVRQWRRQFGIATDDTPFSLLVHVGEDVAGAAQFVRHDRLEAVLSRPGRVEGLPTSRVGEMLRRARADLPIFDADTSTGRFSLAGAQAKIALHRLADGWGDPVGSVPSTHILKPAIPGRDDQDLVEVATMRTASALGLGVARCEVQRFDDERAIVVERYDRVQRSGRWIRVHQEDLAQALGIWPMRKYESQGGPGVARIAELVTSVSRRPVEDAQRFARSLVFNWLVCGTDAHARNYALLINRAAVRLAPLYDLNSHLAYSDGSGNDLSMSVDGEFRAARIGVDHWMRSAPDLRVDREWLREEIARQSRELPQAIRAVVSAPDLARHRSGVLERLVENIVVWAAARRG